MAVVALVPQAHGRPSEHSGISKEVFGSEWRQIMLLFVFISQVPTAALPIQWYSQNSWGH